AIARSRACRRSLFPSAIGFSLRRMSCGHSRKARPTASMSEARDSASAERQRRGNDVTRSRGRMLGATNVVALGGVTGAGAAMLTDGFTPAAAGSMRHATPSNTIPSRAAAIARQRANMSASVLRRARLHVGGVGALFELGAEALDEVRIAPGLENLVELAP